MPSRLQWCCSGNEFHVEQRPCRSIVAKRPGDDILRNQLGDFNSRGWRVHKELNARGGRQTDETSGLSAVLRVYRDRVDHLRYAVKSHLQVEDDV
jgi:hypothetical protein